MAKKKKTQLSSEGKTELAKAIAEKSQTFAKTYANVENQVGKFFRWMSGWLDKLLFNQKHGKLVALILALFFYILISLSQSIDLIDSVSYLKEMGNYEVKPIISSEAFEVTYTGYDSLSDLKVEVSASGDMSDIKNMKQQKGFRIIANMTDLTEGVHSVKLEVENAPSGVKILLNPSTISVEVKKKNIRRFTPGYDYVNKSKMDSVYDLGVPELEKGEVFVRASKDTLDRIAYVKALIKIDDKVTADFDTTAEIAVYDQDGRRMENIDVVPDTMKAHVKVTKPSKDVDIILAPTGKVPNNKAIESYTLDYDKVTLYGKQDILDNINELPISIPASTLTSDREIRMPIPLMNGVSKTDIDAVNISIKLADLKEKEMKDVPLKIKNETTGLSYNIVDNSGKITVTMKGAQKVIDEIKAEDIDVYVDVSKIDKAGTFELPLTVEGKNKLVTYELKNATVHVEATGSVK